MLNLLIVFHETITRYSQWYPEVMSSCQRKQGGTMAPDAPFVSVWFQRHLLLLRYPATTQQQLGRWVTAGSGNTRS